MLRGRGDLSWAWWSWSPSYLGCSGRLVEAQLTCRVQEEVLLLAGTEPLNCFWEPARRPPASTCGKKQTQLPGPRGRAGVGPMGAGWSSSRAGVFASLLAPGGWGVDGGWAEAWNPKRKHENMASTEERSSGTGSCPIMSSQAPPYPDPSS